MDLSHDASGLLGVQGLVAAIPKLQRLRELHLWGNDLTSSGGKVALLATVPSHSSFYLQMSY